MFIDVCGLYWAKASHTWASCKCEGATSSAVRPGVQELAIHGFDPEISELVLCNQRSPGYLCASLNGIDKIQVPFNALGWVDLSSCLLFPEENKLSERTDGADLSAVARRIQRMARGADK